MRAEKQYRQLQRALPPAKHVAGRIDANREPRVLHETDRVGVRIELGLRQPEPGNAAGGIATDFGQTLEVRLQPPRIDVRRRHDLWFTAGNGARDARAQKRKTHDEPRAMAGWG